jgi:hypothetical protein
MFDHLLSKPSGFKEPLRAKQGGGNAESCIVTKNRGTRAMRWIILTQTLHETSQEKAVPSLRAPVPRGLLFLCVKVGVAD